MRVLLANHTPVDGSGSGTYTLTLATGLASRGHEVAVLTPGGGVRSLAPQVRHFVAHELGDHFPSFTGHPRSSILYKHLSTEHLQRVTSAWQRSFDSVISTWGPALIHTQHLWLLTTAALDVAETVVTTCHGSEVACLEGHVDVARRIRKGNAPRTVISISAYVHGLVASYVAAVTSHIVLPNPYDPAYFCYHPKLASMPRAHIGFVGRLVPYKFGERFLDLAQRLADRMPNLKAWFVGDGPERDRLEESSRSRGLTRNVRFLGFQQLSRMPTIYASLDAVIFCGITEPFGLSAIEAAACGTPVFVPDSGGLAEIAVDPHVRRYSWERLDAVVSEIEHLLAEGESESTRLARSQFIRHTYSLGAYLDQLEPVYQSALVPSTHRGMDGGK